MSPTSLRALPLCVVLAACSSTPSPDVIDVTDAQTLDASDIVEAGADVPVDVAAPDVTDTVLPMRDAASDGPTAQTHIEHVIVLLQENHSFDSYFGAWCTAPAGSAPTCTAGPACCEAAPAHEPSGASPTPLTDAENATYSPDHTQACELAEINGGANDRFVTGTACANPRNFAVASTTTLGHYGTYAMQFALADRYFQPLAGASSSNDMYFATSQYVFTDNAFEPNALAHGCAGSPALQTYPDPTIADVLTTAGFSFVAYAEGFDAARRAAPGCMRAPSDCALHLAIYPCTYDPSDNPFQYYPHFTDNPQYIADSASLLTDVATGHLPNFAFVRGLGYHSEHPGAQTTIRDGEAFIDAIVQPVLASPIYANNTLILITWDESGGYYDHIAPPAMSPADHQPYGPRVPMLALGHFARTNFVSHVVMEHSSIVKFLEWNFLGTTGQLHGRDAIVNNIGSMLDPATTGTPVPEN